MKAAEMPVILTARSVVVAGKTTEESRTTTACIHGLSSNFQSHHPRHRAPGER